jgi:hypothetical protein
MNSQPKKTLSRREALKALAAVSGVAVLSSVKNEWETPLVQVGVLPAHAQASNLSNLTLTNGTGGGPLSVTVNGPGSSGPIRSAAEIIIEFANDGESETLTLEPGTYVITVSAEMCPDPLPGSEITVELEAGETEIIVFTCPRPN